ncbi:hypothetical protein [Desulfuromonas sp.]|uniref:hypothetical protein n=1 Tax=Desulfuromonas sp. TaxID=892 RepID=UPI0025B92060|nr:hypothetical protein [Desulfuromonas sp.]
MKEPTYVLNRILKTRRQGITAPANCRLNAILKRDGLESPDCVYIEKVAVRLAQTFHVPVADGVLTEAEWELAFASLEVAAPRIPLPDLLKSQFKKTAEKYPDQVAALLVFDLLIGNRDRASNLKAALNTPGTSLFRGFDHSHVLLNIEDTPEKSIAALKARQLIVLFHPFFGLVMRVFLDLWVERISAVDDRLIRECCVFGRKFQNVSSTTQEALADALVWRKNTLADIVSSHTDQIDPQL